MRPIFDFSYLFKDNKQIKRKSFLVTSGGTKFKILL